MGREDNNNLFADTGFKGTGTFRVTRVYQVFGGIFIAVSIGFLLWQVPGYYIFTYTLAVLFGIISICFILAFYISRVCLYPDKIVHYNFIGRKKEFLWSEITSALIYYTYSRNNWTYTSLQENIDLCTDNAKITLDKRFENYKTINSTVKRKCHRAFPLGKVEHGGTLVLRIDKAVWWLGGSVIAFGMLLVAVNIAKAPVFTSLAIAIHLGTLAPFILIGLVLRHARRVIRAYIDAEGITHVNLFGARKQLMWPEIESVTFIHDSARLSRIRLSGGGKTIVLNRYFRGFESVDNIVTKYCPEKITA